MRDPSRPVFCLVVEDDPLVGLDLADALEAAGFYVAGPFRSGRDAVRWLDRFTPEVAVVDLALTDGLCRDLVTLLRARGIGFVVHSACRRSRSPVGALTAGVWVEKPAHPSAVLAALQQILGPSQESEPPEPLAAMQQE